jgi:hypothetical protein
MYTANNQQAAFQQSQQMPRNQQFGFQTTQYPNQSLLDQSLMSDMVDIKDEPLDMSDIKEEVDMNMDNSNSFNHFKNTSAHSQYAQNNSMSINTAPFFDNSGTHNQVINIGSNSTSPVMGYPIPQRSTLQQQLSQMPNSNLQPSFTDFNGYESDQSFGSVPASPAPIHTMSHTSGVSIPQRIVNRNSTHGMSMISSSVPVDISGMNPLHHRAGMSIAQSPTFHSGSFGALESDYLTQRE